jgi:hypothetical protein
MSETIIITVDENGSPTVAAYCLKTDSWHDFLAFREDAWHAIVEGDQRRGNRFLRAALTCLIHIWKQSSKILEIVGRSRI